MAKKYSVLTVFRAVNKMTKPLMDMEKGVGKYVSKVNREMQKANKMLGSMDRVGKRATAGIAAGAAATGLALADVVKTGAQFDQSMVNAFARFDSVSKRSTEQGILQFESMSRAARTVGASTKFSGQQAADALGFMGMAGEDAQVSMAILGDSANFAAATSVDLATATDIASDSIGILGLQTDNNEQKILNYRRAMDLMAKSSNMANMDINLLFEALKESSGPMRVAGQEIETTMAAIGVLANSGFKGSKGGRGLKILIGNITAPIGRAKKALDGIHFKAFDKTGKIKELPQMLEEITKATENMTEAQRKRFLKDVAGSEAEAQFKALMDMGPDALRQASAEITLADGFSKSQAGDLSDTAMGDLLALDSAFQDLKIGVFKALAPDIRGGTKALTEFLSESGGIKDQIIARVQWLIDNWSWLSEEILKAVKVGMAVWAVVKVMQAFALVMNLVNLAMAASPVTWIVLAIVALIAVVVAIIVYWEELVGWIQESNVWFDALVITLGLLAGPVGVVIGLAVLLIKYWEPVKTFFLNMWEAIKYYFAESINWIKEQLNEAIELSNDLVGTNFEKLEITQVEKPEYKSFFDDEGNLIMKTEFEEDSQSPELPETTLPVKTGFESPEVPELKGVKEGQIPGGLGNDFSGVSSAPKNTVNITSLNTNPKDNPPPPPSSSPPPAPVQGRQDKLDIVIEDQTGNAKVKSSTVTGTIKVKKTGGF